MTDFKADKMTSKDSQGLCGLKYLDRGIVFSAFMQFDPVHKKGS